MPRAAIQIALKTKNPTQVRASQPSEDHRRAGRSPNCRAVGRADSRAKKSALPIRAASWNTVAPMSTPAGGLSTSPPAALTTAPITM